MEELNKRYQTALRALNRLKQDTNLLSNKNNQTIITYYEQFRSAAIQSFECSVDTLWKFIKDYLVKVEGITFDTPTPRAVFKQLWILNLINQHEFDLLSDLIADRNLTSHSYNESTAEDISKKLHDHYELMQIIIDRIDIKEKI